MKCITTFTNSFVLQEIDGSNRVISEQGFRKGGLSYLIKNNNIKFYLREDYFYKNLVWSADIPLTINGVPYNVAALPMALKVIFEDTSSGGTEITVDQVLDSGSTNPIANAPVTIAINEIQETIRQQGQALSNRYTKTEVDNLLENFYTKMQTNEMFAEYSKVSGTTLSLNDKNITI